MFQKEAPLTTSSTIIFPVNPKEKRFSRNVYSEAMTQGRVASTEIDYALCFFEVIISRISSPSELKKSFTLRYLMPFTVLMFFKLVGEMDNPSYAWSWFWIYSILGVSIQLLSRHTQVAKAKTDLEEAIKIVQPTFLKKGLKWRVPQDPSVWIELVKEYRQTGEPLIPVVHQVNYQGMSEVVEVVAEEKYQTLSEEVRENEEDTDYTTITGPVVSYGFAEK